ncbi:MAG: hypothetical protein AAGA31_21850, partial [Bacteroidota bacterium]
MYLLLLALNFLGPNPCVDLVDKPLEQASLFTSTDAGQCWQAFENGLPERVDPHSVFEHASYLFLSTRNAGLFRMDLKEEELSWQESSQGLHPEAFIIDIVAKGDTMVLNTYWRGIYISKDGGKNWRQPIFNLKGQVEGLYFDDNRLLATSDRGIFESWNGGESWQQKWDIHHVRYLTRYKGQLVAARQNTIGTLNSDGPSWAEIETKWAIIGLFPQEDYLYARTAAGIMLRSEDGINWEQNDEQACRKATGSKSVAETLWG